MPEHVNHRFYPAIILTFGSRHLKLRLDWYVILVESAFTNQLQQEQYDKQELTSIGTLVI